MKQRLSTRFRRPRRGESKVSYSILIGLIAVLALVSVEEVGTEVSRIFALGGNRLGDIAEGAEGGETTSPPETPLPPPPVANNDAGFVVDVDGSAVIFVADLLANDSPSDGLTVTSVDNPVGGTVVLASEAVTFTPTDPPGSPAGFDYTIADRYARTSVGSVSLTIRPSAPSAGNDTLVLHAQADNTVAIASLLRNDGGDSLQLTGISDEENVTVTQEDDALVVRPTIDPPGTARFAYTVADSFGRTSSATVTIEAAPLPVANDDEAEAWAGQATPIPFATVLANDVGHNIEIDSVDEASAVNGTVALDRANARFLFTANADAQTASFAYRIKDDIGDTVSAPATVALTVKEPPANWVAMSSVDKKIFSSPDGVTWTDRTANIYNESNGSPRSISSWPPESIVYANGRWLAVLNNGSSGAVMWSDDGITWTFRPVTQKIHKLAHHSGNRFYASGKNGSTCYIYRSEDGGYTWAQDWSFTCNTNDSNKAFAIGNGQLVAVQTGGTRVFSTNNGVSWSDPPEGGLNTPQSAVWSPEFARFIYGQGDGKIRLDTSVASLSQMQIIEMNAAVNGIATGVIGGSALAVFAVGNKIYTSANLTSFQSRASLGTGTMWTADFGKDGMGNTRIVAGGSGVVFYSNDGVSWQQAAVPGGHTINYIAAKR